MRIDRVHIDYVVTAFKTMQGKEDFLDLLNYSKKVLLGEKAFPFEMKQLNYYIVRQNQKRKYKTFSVKKKSGGERIIHAPVKGLKVLQVCLNLILQSVFEPHRIDEMIQLKGNRDLYNKQFHLQPGRFID